MASPFGYRVECPLATTTAADLQSLARADPLADAPDSSWAERGRRHPERAVLVVLQAVNAGGKDGTIEAVKELTGLRRIRVERLKRPVEPSADHDLLRLARSLLPRAGEIVFYNRSYYEDLVHLARRQHEAEFSRLRDEIVRFEDELAQTQTQTWLVKLHLHIDKDEQRRRLEARLQPPLLHLHNPFDHRDQTDWPQLMSAFDAVLRATHTTTSPWFVIPANDRRFRNAAVIDVLGQVV